MTNEQLARLPEVLFQIGKAIGSDEDLGMLLSHISQLICELTGADAVSIMLLDIEEERLLIKAAHGLPTDRLHRISFEVGEGVAGWVVPARACSARARRGAARAPRPSAVRGSPTRHR